MGGGGGNQLCRSETTSHVGGGEASSVDLKLPVIWGGGGAVL